MIDTHESAHDEDYEEDGAAAEAPDDVSDEAEDGEEASEREEPEVAPRPAAGRVEFTVDDDDAGQRLDRYLTARVEHISRNQVQTLIDEGRVLVGGMAKKASLKLEAGEHVEIEIPGAPSEAVEPENIPLDILYSDDALAVINKPAGMIVHPGAGRDTGTLVAALLHHFGSYEKLSTLGGPLRPGIVHRLDKDTSGLILVALTDAAHEKLVEEFRERRIAKQYVALLHGKLPGESGTIELPIARDLKRRSRMTARRREGREARTDWRLKLRFENFAFVECDLHTGRTHQIRVHFSALGAPVVGDTVYGAPRQEHVGRESLPEQGRNFLHAARLAFDHPVTKKRITFSAPLPAELVTYMNRLGRASGADLATIDAALKPFL